MSLKIDEYLSNCGALSSLVQQNENTTVQAAESSEKERDSYISSVSNSEEAIPCENYNDILQVIKSAKAEAGGTATSSEASEGTESVGSSGGSGGSSESEEETTTEIVTINGVTYLEITTTSNGVTSVTRTVLSKQNNGNEETGSVEAVAENVKEAENEKLV